MVFGYEVLCIDFQVAALLSLVLRAHVAPQKGLSETVRDEAIFQTYPASAGPPWQELFPTMLFV